MSDEKLNERCTSAQSQEHETTPRTVATTRRGAGVAVGRPEDPETPLGQSMSRYHNSTRRPCGMCGRPTWYGPGLMEKIAEGAHASCGDCAFLALALGARPSAIVHLGGRAIDDAR